MRRLIAVLAAVLAVAGTRMNVLAQADPLVPFQPVSGVVAEGETDRYTFAGVSGQVISARVTGADGFDPVVTLYDGSGARLIGDDDAFSGSRDALLQAVTLPRIDTYTLEVGGYGGSAGEYDLLLNTGFGEIAYTSDFADGDAWAPADTDTTTWDGQAGAGQIGFTGLAASGIVTYQEDSYQDAAVRAQVSGVSGATWVAGVTARATEAGAYAFQVNADGRWRFVYLAGDAPPEVLSDWRSHPAIRPGETRFSIMMMARGGGFDFFYSDAFLGSVADAGRIRAGQIGLLAGTIATQSATTGVTYESVQVTVPATNDGEDVIPAELIISDGVNMAQALVRRHVAGANGELTLTVPTATVTFARGGVSTFLLGQRREFTDFALGATVTLTNGRLDPNGCGLVFRYTDDANYAVAFLDAQGGHGVSEQVEGQFQPGLFAESDRLAGGGQHHLLVIASGNRLFYYIDGISAGSMEIGEQAGQVGAAVVNYAASETNCTFANVWLWEWPAA
jgi:hypothetical protein